LELQQEVAINAQNTQAEKTIKTITDSHEGFQKEFIEQLESLIQSNKDSHNQTRKSLLYALGQARSTEMSILASFTVSYHKRSPARNS
jgi:lipid II:glycine glycyltransferase (peptidoglycan interpeptide bridge formation enzyme)